MTWPWVSRRALDLALEERDRLRAQVDRLTDHLTRIERRQAGLPETPRKERPAPEAMPRELLRYIRGHASGPMRREMIRVARTRHLAGEDWQSIQDDVMGEGDPDGDQEAGDDM